MNESEITVEILSKRTEYQEIINHFKKWNTWQQHYFFCHYTQILDIKILEILLTDFEPLYHSGYKKTNEEKVSSAKAAADSGTSITTKNNKSKKFRRKKMCRIPRERLYHKHVTEDVFKDKTMADYIKKPNPINLKVYSQTMSTEQMKQLFLEELDYLDKICANWETYEFIHLIHLLFPFCDKPTLFYLSSCVNKRVYAHDSVLKLPDRAVQIICAYLRPEDLARTALVSKTWFRYSYRSPAWKIGALNINYTGIDFSRFAERSEDTIWRRIYLELLEINKQKTVKPRMRFGSIVQSFSPVQIATPKDIIKARRESQARVAPDLVKFWFKKSVINKTLPQVIEKDKQSVKHTNKPIVPRLVTPAVMSDSEGSSSTDSNDNIMMVTPSIDNIPELPVGFDEGGLNRISSVHASCCLEDEIAYEEAFPPKQHSEKHAKFIQDITGYTACISALATTYPLKSVDELLGHKQAVHTFQADALRLISGCGSGMIRIWDIRTGRPVKKVMAHNGAVNSLQFDGNKVVTGGWDTFVKVFSVYSLRLYCVLSGHTESVTTVFFNKTHLISTSLDKTLRVYVPNATQNPDQVVTYSCEQVIVGHEAGITHGDMDAEFIYSSSLDQTIRLWSAKFYNPVRVIHCGAEIRHFTFNDKLIIAATDNKRLLFADRREETPSHHILTGDFVVNYIWLYGSRFITGDTGGLVNEWDLPSGAMLRTLHGHLGPVLCVQANQQQIITCSFDQAVKIWHLTELKSSGNALE